MFPEYCLIALKTRLVPVSTTVALSSGISRREKSFESIFSLNYQILFFFLLAPSLFLFLVLLLHPLSVCLSLSFISIYQFYFCFFCHVVAVPTCQNLLKRKSLKHVMVDRDGVDVIYNYIIMCHILRIYV